MRISLLILSISTVFNFFSYSQSAFENGYFINEDDQKINCLIENLDWKSNPREFKYKLAESLEIKTADVFSAKEFGIHDVCKFITAKVQIDRSSAGLHRMNSNKHPVFNEEQLFLKVLVEGGASLFFYEDGNGRAFFYQTNGSEIQQLIYKEYLTRDNMIAENTSFRQQLYNDLKCQDITMADLKDIKYAEKSLERIVVAYNVCMNSEYRSFKTKNKDLLTLTIRPGLNISSLSGKYANTTLRDFDLGPELRFRLGIEAEVILPFRNNNRWALIAEPTYQSFRSSKGEENDEISGGILVSTVDYTSIEFPLGVRHYFFLKNKSKIFINAALVVDFNFNSSIQFARADNSVLDTEKFESKPNIAFGVGYKPKARYSLEIRYLSNREVLGYSSWNSSYNTFSAIVGYSF